MENAGFTTRLKLEFHENWNENVVFVVVECEFNIEYSHIDHSHGPSKTFSIAFT